MFIRHNTIDAVVDTLRVLIQAICDGSDLNQYIIKAGKGSNDLHIGLYCRQPEHVGLLVGKRLNGVSAPTKKAMLRILHVIARRNGLDNVTLKIEDTSKIKESDSNGQGK